MKSFVSPNSREMHTIDILIVILVTGLLILFIKNYYGEREYLKSSIDDRYYLVYKLKNSQQAADYLAEINSKLLRLTRHMMAKYGESKDAHQLYQNFNPNSIQEGSPDSGYTSYSYNKGEKLILCIRQADHSFVDKNVIMYVSIHELAHIMTKEVGHTQMFWDNFKFLLQEAINLGLYKKIDFNKKPKDYCGIKISNSII